MFKKLCFFLILISFFSVFGCRISGTITDNGAGIGGVTVSLSGDAAMIVMTNSEGKYTFNSVMPGSYTITPDKPDYTFDPESAAVTKTQLLADVDGIDFEKITSRIVFLTSGSYNGGEFGGLTGADEICRAEADAGGLTGTYAAWLSGSTAAESAAGRINQSGGPFVLPDGTVVADDWADLTDGDLKQGINMEADGTLLNGSRMVWTGTDTNGEIYNSGSQACADWTSVSSPEGSAGGSGGSSGNTGNGWTQGLNTGCQNERSLYCFEQ